MTHRISKRVAGLVAGLLVLVGAGAAVAASGACSDDFLADVAKRLGVTQDALEDAIVGAREAQLDKAVADGALTEEQAKRLKERLESGDLGPGFGGPGFGHRGFGQPGFGHHAFGGLDAASTYLGLTDAELRAALMEGKSLADVAKEEGKSVDGLKAAIRKAHEERLAEAVKDGRLTQAQADSLADRLAEVVDDLVERTPGERGMGPAERGFGGWDGPPGFSRETTVLAY